MQATIIDAGEIVYPQHMASRDGWTPSSIPLPIAPLEFDLQAKAFALGFRRALSGLLGRDIEVAVRRSRGHLFTLVAGADQVGSVPEEAFGSPVDYRTAWANHVRPRGEHLVSQMAAAATRATPGTADRILEVAAANLEELTYLHHTLLVPARASLARLVDQAADIGMFDSALGAARSTFELRRLVMKIGHMLAARGFIDHATEVVLLHADEIATPDRRLRTRTASRRHELELPQPGMQGGGAQAATRLGTAEPGCSTGYLRQVLGRGTPATASAATGHRMGVGASSGVATGPIRRLIRQVDLGTVQPGDIILAPNNSAVWSFALPFAGAVLAPGGSLFGHLASLARDFTRPAIVGLGAEVDDLTEGTVVTVDGSSGTVLTNPTEKTR